MPWSFRPRVKHFMWDPPSRKGGLANRSRKPLKAANPIFACGRKTRVRTHCVAQGLNDRGIANGTIGVEETAKFVFTDNLRKAAPSATFASATPVTAGCRMIKSGHEIDLMRLAAKVTLAAYDATYRSMKVGMTQQDVQDMVEVAHRKLGFEGGADVQVGDIFSFSAWLDRSTRHSRKHDRDDGRWLFRRRISIRHHAHLRTRQSQPTR